MADSTERLNMDELVKIVVTEAGLSPCDTKKPYRLNRKQLLELIAYLRAMKHTAESISKRLEEGIG